ncbi:MAG: PilT/PilU family type 4a pilus ATPase [Candidatus Omnitrophica bacterium]|nr:PilT/PilU family type 4a pilus ATPase [Candidatus Omnitrophota bacterium]
MPKIDLLFRKVIADKGSDLHLQQGQRPKIRINGELCEVSVENPLTRANMRELLLEITSKECWSVFEKTGDVDFAYTLGEEGRFRVNFYRNFFGFGAVFRLIPSKIVQLKDLDMPASVKTLADIQSGLVLVTGPTGSGKSTTLASLIDHINRTKLKKIVTIEEPVEFIHSNQRSIITHREVGLDTESFSSGLRGAIKSDAEIILVGEMRDRETTMLALTAAQMGILVFGTLHTNSAAKTVDRVVDMFPANQKQQVRTILANTLQGIVSQQLLRSKDGSRRWAACEILLKSMALTSILMDGDVSKLVSEIQNNRGKGMISLDDSLLDLVRTGKVTREVAYMKALNKAMFNAALGVSA